ncbi:hypothetical protein CEXT_248081 [Caerostris extrusa]|uniref:Uncharacterized protein n=1 Tax=Caerostris extrusa TaxID=172846 RepID=A0AAV4XS08_CAEEX|nr:hypothetical protein CEXT_248081 [Caerostris extrusa]
MTCCVGASPSDSGTRGRALGENGMRPVRVLGNVLLSGIPGALATSVAAERAKEQRQKIAAQRVWKASCATDTEVTSPDHPDSQTTPFQYPLTVGVTRGQDEEQPLGTTKAKAKGSCVKESNGTAGNEKLREETGEQGKKQVSFPCLPGRNPLHSAENKFKPWRWGERGFVE